MQYSGVHNAVEWKAWARFFFATEARIVYHVHRCCGGRFLLSRIFSNHQNDGRYRCKTFSIHYPASIGVSVKMSGIKLLINCLESHILVASSQGVIDQNGKCSKAPRMCRFEVKRERKTVKYVKLYALRNDYIMFYLPDFDLKSSKF